MAEKIKGSTLICRVANDFGGSLGDAFKALQSDLEGATIAPWIEKFIDRVGQAVRDRNNSPPEVILEALLRTREDGGPDAAASLLIAQEGKTPMALARITPNQARGLLSLAFRTGSGELAVQQVVAAGLDALGLKNTAPSVVLGHLPDEEPT